MLSHTGPGSTQYLLVQDALGLEAVTSLGPLGVVSLTGADMDADGDTDLIFGINTSPDLARPPRR